MKIIIIRKAPKKTQRFISNQFPSKWEIVFVSSDELAQEIEDTDILIPENQFISISTINKAKKLKLIQTGAGYDTIPIDECTRKGIYVANAPGINARAVAEHVFALMLCWYKNIIPLNTAMKKGDGVFDYTGSELSNKIIGIIGLGNIGKRVAKLANAFDMRVLGYDCRKVYIGNRVKFVDWKNLFELSDVITVHIPLNDQTYHAIGREEFEIMKPNSFLINTSRGAVIDEHALIQALQDKKIGGAGLDVFEEEPLPSESMLCRLDNSILTPHMAGEPDGLYFHSKRFKFFVENIKRVSKGMPPKYALNKF